ncbi:phosphoribosyltransferase [Sphingomonas xinjiangensis]|uniref:Phosphoribosyltransferase domain-containing protein n=1 Tax=Sphingomonas xinjiangensis TaxID=643568 RepID=A0A840YJJ4_9SPHN|nr:phosphoribosyltransferase family protein [Sphingomonas xinjiangensis]MBB5708960.1 hypothetical protein [Sphingomonas xinjiangensis]
MSEIVFTHLPHEDLVAGVHAIADAAAHWSPTLLVGVGRGGLVPAVYLSHRMGLPTVSIDHSSGIAAFGADRLAPLAALTRNGERLLLVEDINDTGGTIGTLRAALAAHDARADNIRFAVLLDNIRSGQRTDYAFRAIDRDVTKDWFVFPWEAVAPKASIDHDAAEVPERIA